MKKRILSLLCVFAILLSMSGNVAIPAEAVEETKGTDVTPYTSYRVGYARVDINPYIDPTLTGAALVAQSNIMALPLYGSGDVWNRLSTYGLVDDNGDGVLNTEDGLKATCIAITDSKGNTILLITVDMIGALQSTRIRNAVMDRVNAALMSGEVSDVVMDISRIYYTGTHTHNAPQADAYSANGRTDFNNDGVDLNVVNTNLGIWIDRTVENIAEAAILALKDRAEATVTKDSVDASSCTDTAVKGKTMNSVRHYVAEDKGCVAGDNFNDRGSNPKQVTQVNDVMHLLQFTFTDSSKLPIVVANWRAHPSLNNTTSTNYKDCSRNCISSDFVNSFRRTLEYNATITSTGKVLSAGSACRRVAFFQAAGGNVNPRGYEKTNGVAAYSWIDTNAKNLGTSRGNVYGRVLGAMAKNGITTSAGRETVAAGEIRTMRYYKNVARNTTGVSALAYEAAKYYQANVGTGTYVYTSPYSGEIYVIGSKFHANSLISKWTVATQTPLAGNATMEINTVLVGEDLAFVTGSGELFDYYYKEKGVFTEENNAWNDLNNTATYGTPFVLELCNAMNGYVPNYYAYDYNLDSQKWARGSYEAHTTSYSQGTGEEMIQTMKRMLDTLAVSSDGTRQQVCEHCGVEVTWYPYDGKTAMENNGHYYLPEDNRAAQIHVKDGKTLCFDLNGHTLTGDSRAFYTVSGGNATLNLMDSSAAKTGVVRGGPGVTGANAGFGGGVILVDKSNTLNLYGGTLEFIKDDLHSVSSGGVLYVSGTVNMYGGTIRGGYADSFTGQYISGGKVAEITRVGYGASVFLNGTFNMYGGVVESGTLRLVTGSVGKDTLGNDVSIQEITDREGIGECFYVSKNGKLLLSGNATVGDVYLAGGTAANLTVKGNYTGALKLSYPENTNLEPGQKIAAAVDADVYDAEITFGAMEDMTAAVKGNELIVSESPYSYIYCKHCQATVQWTPITDAELDLAENTKGMKPGHYMLTENVVTTQKQLNPDGKNPGNFCFELNGYEYHGDTRAFYVYNNATLSIQNRRDTGFVQGDRGANNYGGTLYCYGAAAVINIYDVTVKATPVDNLRGSAIFVKSGTINLYDATLLGNYSKEYGGTVFCDNGAKLTVSGGTIAAGRTDGLGNCIYMCPSSWATVEGDAVIDEIYIYSNPADAITVDTTKQPFTGSLVFRFNTAVAAGTDVGNITGTKGITGTLTEANSGMEIIADGTNLITAAMAVTICTDGQEQQHFATLEKAIAAYTGESRSYIRLNEDLNTNATITKDVFLDLNGNDLTGSITVNAGATLYVMDSATDDYTVFDEAGYGQLAATLTGTVLPVPENTVSAPETVDNPYRAGYIPMVRQEGISYHRINLQIDTMTLRPGSVGLYYQCPFLADEVIAEDIYSFGIALSVYGTPNADNMETECEYSANICFEGGKAGNMFAGTLLQNIMRTTNSDGINAGNAQTLIYGRAYVLTESGYIFGQSVAQSFCDLVCGVDAVWNSLNIQQQQGVLELVRDYESVMSTWEIPNILESYRH